MMTNIEGDFWVDLREITEIDLLSEPDNSVLLNAFHQLNSGIIDKEDYLKIRDENNPLPTNFVTLYRTKHFEKLFRREGRKLYDAWVEWHKERRSTVDSWESPINVNESSQASTKERTLSDLYATKW